ncbi:MAG: GGDEF domain-containing protein [Sulfurospirillaceae bacterium]|nr:GGDEF domain-containing protein [Sulfurospirillaceae bacterium]
MTSALAQSVDGDLHANIRTKDGEISKEYLKTIAPLTHFHNANPKIVSIYTVIEIDKKPYYILNTLNDPSLKIKKEIEPTSILEEVIIEEKNQDKWIDVVKSGNIYVTPDFETDNYGTFLSGHAPIYNSNGQFEAILGIDYDAKGYEDGIKHYTKIFLLSLSISILLSLVASIVIYFLLKQLKISYTEVQKLSHFDRLTGLFNRFVFIDFFNNELEKSKRLKHSLFLVILDIDDFKGINDEFGHLVGDEAIKFTANNLKNILRKTDIIARFGGDEFLICITDKDSTFIEDVVTRILNDISTNTIKIEKNDTQKEININLSIGYTAYKDGDDFKSMLQRADQALYISKEAGKNTATMLA